ncbi:MAG: LptF/LptG family permease [Prevotellaceae bacterium]|jgi:lipopolysaccharide export system permease protein|nr:LptF/LptG family permease [Prevotellaceae bacterium]
MRIKRLYLFLIKDYLGSFFATFFICLFVVLMQFLWRYVDEMVGKGLDFTVLASFLYYAALSLIPMALPLAVLLSSLMTFGNLGERLELLAMKAAGISLFRIMRPFILFILLISVGAFFFSNNAMPVIQTKLWTLLLSMRQKSPEVEIPAGEFYQGINNYNIYVRSKDNERKLLKDMMIYDFTNGFENAVVMSADSGRIKMSADKKNLILELHSGESFENLRQQQRGQKNVPYRRETFAYKEILIEFDSNFNMMDASVVSNRYLAKDMEALTYTIDSLTAYSDSLVRKNVNEFQNRRYFGKDFLNPEKICRDSLPDYSAYTTDSFWNAKSLQQQREILHRATMTASQNKSDIAFFFIEKESVDRVNRRHDIERHRKFTLSFACLVFFFIGAPLGAIIRKGGLGIPVVVSVFLFIVYYIVDNTGYKMARDGIWPVGQGIWLSTVVLMPLGIYLTYKAATDSMISLDVLNPKKWWSRIKKRKTGSH